MPRGDRPSEVRSPHSTTATERGIVSPLGGVRILDFTHVLAGPFCTRLLADLGATVVRVESSKHPDAPWKSAIDASIDRDVSYSVINRNKRSMVIDLKKPKGRDLAARLAARADVLAENFSAGVMQRLELGYEELCKTNPRLIYVSMSGYGNAGPRRSWTSMNTNLQAYSGLMMVTGYAEDPPTAISNSWLDYIGGLHAAFAILDALFRRAEKGHGRWIDMSQFEAGVATIGPLLMAGAATGSIPPRAGNRSTSAAPQRCYRCAGEDDWCAISIQTDHEWQRLLDAMERPSWGNDSRFESALGRLHHQDEIDAHVTEWTRLRPSIDVEQSLRRAGLSARRMRRVDDILQGPERSGVYHPADNSSGFDLMMTGLPFAMESVALPPVGRAPRLGEHTHEVLGRWLDLGDEEIARLRREEVLV